MTTKDTPAPKPEAKPRATLKRACEIVSLTISDERAAGDVQRGKEDIAACSVVGDLFGVDIPTVHAHVDALRAKAKADATLAALTGKGGK